MSLKHGLTVVYPCSIFNGFRPDLKKYAFTYFKTILPLYMLRIGVTSALNYYGICSRLLLRNLSFKPNSFVITLPPLLFSPFSHRCCCAITILAPTTHSRSTHSSILTSVQWLASPKPICPMPRSNTIPSKSYPTNIIDAHRLAPSERRARRGIKPSPQTRSSHLLTVSYRTTSHTPNTMSTPPNAPRIRCVPLPEVRTPSLNAVTARPVSQTPTRYIPRNVSAAPRPAPASTPRPPNAPRMRPTPLPDSSIAAHIFWDGIRWWTFLGGDIHGLEISLLVLF
ncbi:hypothetical protein M422DRAFT_776282 [Sphaerobolus stellatus SS14]|nr:hypothetical protein M422DRAFT_776282 [Sphaerobolus stellatus SS14]